MNRREALTSVLAVSTATVMPVEIQKEKQGSFIYSLNMSTLRGHKLGFRSELEMAAKAGFKSVEIWINTLQDYIKNRGISGRSKTNN